MLFDYTLHFPIWENGGFHVISSDVLRQTALKKYTYLNKYLECSEIGRHCYLPVVKACRLLRDNGIVHRYHHKYVKTTDSEHQLAFAPNLLNRQFDDFGINQAWCGDITYIPTREGWLY